MSSTHEGRAGTPLGVAWKIAAADLGFEFASPFTFKDLVGRAHTCSGLVTHFGGRMGTLIVSRDDEDSDAAVAAETLIDWGWYGPIERMPTWVPRTPRPDEPR